MYVVRRVGCVVGQREGRGSRLRRRISPARLDVRAVCRRKHWAENRVRGIYFSWS